MSETQRVEEPLLFERQCLEKVWGGRSLQQVLGIPLPDGRKIGETWELSDRAERPSVVARGALRGRTLPDLMRTHREALLGRAKASADGRFPLLVKYLDATENLSIQVHPHRGMAQTLGPGESPKTECWYVLAAARGSGIWHGLRPGVDAQQLAAAAPGPGILPLLSWYRAEAGQFFHVPGGTVHAIGAGVTLVEIQEPSDTTYRLYDWDRTAADGQPREVSVDRALRSIRQQRSLRRPRRPYRRGIAGNDDPNKRARCMDGDEFAVDLLELGTTFDESTGGMPIVYVVVGGRGGLRRLGGGVDFALAKGETWLVPACFGPHRFEPEETLRLLRAVPRG